jgi:NADH-quinone oxidoreductase subunit M
LLLRQKDLKQLVAYSSVSHMGYVMLGMATFTTQGINGAVLQMFNHGTITGMLFLLVGVIYDRAHHRDIEGFGGLAAIMPIYTGVTALAFFASMGLPGLSGFISEVLVLLGSWQKFHARHYETACHPDRRLPPVDDSARLPGPSQREVQVASRD